MSLLEVNGGPLVQAIPRTPPAFQNLDMPCFPLTTPPKPRERARHRVPTPDMPAGAFRFNFEEQDLDEGGLRRLVLDEISRYHQRRSGAPPPVQPQPNVVV